MPTLEILANEVRRLAHEKQQGSPLLEHETTRDRLTRARAKDVGTQSRHIARGLGRSGPEAVDATELTEENLLVVREQMTRLGFKTDVCANTASTFRLLRDLAIELGVPVAVRKKRPRPEKNRVYRKQGDDYVRVARAAHVVNNEPYALRFFKWPLRLQQQWQDCFVPFYTDPFHEPYNGNVLAPKTLALRLQLAERAFGIQRLLGVALEDLSFESLIDLDTMKKHHAYLAKRAGGKHTVSIQLYLNNWKSVALNFYQDKAANDAFYLYMRRFEWVAVKNKDDLPLRVHADDLYHAWYAMIAEAEWYEATVHQKYGRVHAQAQMAYYWHCAAVFGFTLATLLRQENVADAILGEIYKKPDGSWHYCFEADDMKGKRRKRDEVVDFWKGDEAQAFIGYVLDKAVETRPFLLEKFRMQNPGLPDPENFFLNMDGKGYSYSAMRLLFETTMVKYVGPEKRISQHDVRTIIPSWLVVREDPDIKHTIQRLLDHKDYKTTDNFYIKTEGIYGARLAKLRMDERAKQRKLQERLAKIPDQVAGMLRAFKQEILTALSEQQGFDRDTLRLLLREMIEGDIAPEKYAS